MSESLNCTYSSLITKTVAEAKEKYKNIDSVTGDLVNQDIIYKSNTFARSGGRNTDSYTVYVRAMSNKTFTAVPSDSLELTIQNKVKEVCNCALNDTVTAKGLLAYMNFITWFFEKGTSVLKRAGDEKAPYLTIPDVSKYDGVTKKEKNDYILKSDFDSYLNTLKSVAVASALTDATTYSITGTCSSSSCSSSSCSSSSCSSSSCSSSSSSSCCSSSSSSSSSSSVFIAYMKLY